MGGGGVADPPACSTLDPNRAKNPCVLCSAAAYCCGAVGPRPIAALLGRFLPRLGPLVHSSGPFFLGLVIPDFLPPSFRGAPFGASPESIGPHARQLNGFRARAARAP